MGIHAKLKTAQKRMSGFWAIEEKGFNSIKEIYSSFNRSPKEFISEIGAFDNLFGMESEEILSIDGDTAYISISGPLVNTHDCGTIFHGCTSYEDINSAIDEISSNNSIEKVVFNIDSPGGMVTGVDNTSVAIKEIGIPTEARVGDMAASAAYWLASQCDSIVATAPTAAFGSIGVVIEYWDSERAMETLGYDKVSITSTGAPDKRVDAKTDEGRRKVISDLDEIEKIFFRRVAEGRGTTTSAVASDFGKGGMFLAEKSLRAGMIDKTDFILKNNVTSKINNNENPMEKSMKLSEILSKHPAVQGEIDTIVNSAVEKIESSHNAINEESKKNLDAASKYLTSSYDNKVKNLAIEVIKGEKSIESLEVVVAFLDKKVEGEASDKAADETEEVGETPAAETEVVAKENIGKIHNEESYGDAVTRLKTKQ